MKWNISSGLLAIVMSSWERCLFRSSVPFPEDCGTVLARRTQGPFGRCTKRREVKGRLGARRDLTDGWPLPFHVFLLSPSLCRSRVPTAVKSLCTLTWTGQVPREAPHTADADEDFLAREVRGAFLSLGVKDTLGRGSARGVDEGGAETPAQAP